MDAAKLQLLEMIDDLVACEYPANFDFCASMQRVKALKPKLDAIAQKSFEIDENVQDASFFTELAIFEEFHPSNTRKFDCGEQIGEIACPRFVSWVGFGGKGQGLVYVLSLISILM